MKHPHIFCSLLPLASAVAVVSCADDSLLDPPALVGDSSYIRFSPVPVSVSSGVTRAGEEKPLYDPLVLNADSEDYPIYLHTYEHPLEDEASATATRGVPVASNSDFLSIHKSFGVEAFNVSKGVTYYPLEETTPVDSSTDTFWTTKTAHSWPSNNRLNFSAIAPWNQRKELKNLHFEEKTISFSYSAQKGSGDLKDRDAEAQADLMLASSSFTREEAAQYNHHVPLRFNHALSAVRFAVRDVLEGEVVSIAIKGVFGSGDCSFTADNDGTNGSFSWSGHSDVTDYTQIFNEKISGGNFDPTDDTNDRVLNPTKEKTFMLVPQQIPDDAVIEIVIKRKNVSPLPETITVSGFITKNNVKEWKAGYEYVYTISTSADNWVYVFDVTGNEAEGFGNIHVYSPSDPKFQANKNTGYYDVVSYRYKANDIYFKEPLPWKATHGGSESYYVTNHNVYEGKWIDADKWITDKGKSSLSGDGGFDMERHDLDFYPHYLMTDWNGDKTMQTLKMYDSQNSETKPWDLSTFGGQKSQRSTANCYIVDRGGWYCFPLVYGNAVKNGATNSDSYTSQASGSGILNNFINHNGQAITDPYINPGSNATASLVWEDAYNLVSEVELVNIYSENMIRFYVDSDNLQQGNAIIALKNSSGDVMWSWHIWATEHWLDSNGKPNAFSSSAEFGWSENSQSHLREKGDVEITYGQGTRSFKMSPYNLGWCDAKNVDYLKRESKMEFTQYMSDGKTPTKKIANLPIVQEGSRVAYKIGNNTYYQFGRKDPQVGFWDYQQGLKANFGPTTYKVESQKYKTLAEGIRNPHIMYAGKGGDPNVKPQTDPDCQDWTNERYMNLWNNSDDISNMADTGSETSLWSHVKTVYDPSPAGYMVPNAGVWRVLGQGDGLTGKTYTKDQFESKINGKIFKTIKDAPGLDDLHYYKIWGKGEKDDNANALYLVPTGHRWFSDDWTIYQLYKGESSKRAVKAGENYNLRLFYAWSNHWCQVYKYGTTTLDDDASSYYSAFGASIGIDGPTGTGYWLGAQFIGRRAMARPVRAIQEP